MSRKGRPQVTNSVALTRHVRGRLPVHIGSRQGLIMRKVLAGLFVTAVLTGCGEEDKYIGTWISTATPARYVLSKDGECSYYQIQGGGIDCEWKPDSDGIVITFRKNGRFIEQSGDIAGKQLYLSGPGGTDSFVKQNTG